MKKVILVVALLTMVAFVSGVMAQTKPAPAPAKPAGTAAPAAAPEKPAKAEKMAKTEKFSGTVEKVDEMAKTVVVKGKKGDMTFAVDAAKITKGGKDMPLSDLKSGMSVSIEYKKEGDKMMASSVKASAPKAAKSEKKTEKPAETPKK